jgi:hypothetical protein
MFVAALLDELGRNATESTKSRSFYRESAVAARSTAAAARPIAASIPGASLVASAERISGNGVPA